VTGILSSLMKMKTGRNSKSEIAPGLYTLLYQWLTSSRVPTANLSAIDLAVVISEARELIRSNGNLVVKSNRLQKLGPSSAQNASVRALYAAFNFANPCRRSSSSTRVLRISEATSKCCCYHHLMLRVSCAPTLAAAHYCRVDQESEVH